MNSDQVSAEVSPLQLKSILEGGHSGVVLVDVRENVEFEDWSIEGSVNIPLSKIDFVQRVRDCAAGRNVLTICTQGTRSMFAIKTLREEGIEASSLSGGLVGWGKVYTRTAVPLRDSETTLLQIRRMSKGCASYIIASGGECVVVDPSSKIDEYLSIAKNDNCEITHVVDTHKHADHISGARTLSKETGAALHLNVLDSYRFTDFEQLQDGGRISIGNKGVAITAMHTPGHTKGSTSLQVSDEAVLVGDTMFLDGIGRPDLHEAQTEYAIRLYETCCRMALCLNPGIKILPAHFAPGAQLLSPLALTAPLSEIAQKNGFGSRSQEKFLKLLLHHTPAKPPNYQTILKINSGEALLDLTDADLLEEGPNRCLIQPSLF
ncbi:MAG: MBL fold metallo-hydrolase [Nitrospirae bacterium]|nr:MAG: MBL fold metallo-hydrolase [Nitrospirota bacterium]